MNYIKIGEKIKPNPDEREIYTSAAIFDAEAEVVNVSVRLWFM